MYIIFGACITIALLLMDLYKRRVTIKREVPKMLLEVQERMSQQFSQEIHDNVGQLLSLARIQLHLLRKAGHLDLERIGHVDDIIGKALSDLRDLSKGLSSERIMTSPLDELLQQQCVDISHSGVIQAALHIEGVVRSIGGKKQLIVFRIVQECIQNCLKHAEASTITIRLWYEQQGVRMEVSDDGRGFNLAEKSKANEGAGLANIRRRIALSNGESAIESIVGSGTKVKVYIPYSQR